MALINIKYFSEALGMNTSFYAIINQKSKKGEYGTESSKSSRKNILLLHGLSDDESIWERRTSIERYAAEHGVNIIMPFGARSFYTDMKYGGKYYTHVAKEIPETACSLFNISDEKENWYVAGLSMGGYGALKIALKERERFSGGAALSPVTNLYNENFKKDIVPIFGENPVVPESEDLFALTKKIASCSDKPRLFAVTGKDDFMFDDYKRFISHMEKLDYDFTEYIDEGSHNWAFWDKHIQNALKWIVG